MTAEPPESPVAEAGPSLDVRWFFPGQLDAAVARWFGRFPAGMESLEDSYLLDPPPRWCSPRPSRHRSNTTLKSFCMLATVQPRSFALASAFSEPAS
jgi:hypothetical protein